ncbi:MAG: GNAT family N-acetyltransferase [Anaerolineales bacterium]
MNFDFKPASDYPLADLVTWLNQGFENYFVPIHFNVAQFLSMVRKDGIDLTSSRVLLADETPSGIALIARRGWTSRLAAMGLSSPIRGKGAGSWFMRGLVQEARERGEHEMVLEVIEQNEPAVALYKRAGFEIVRRLVGFERSAKSPDLAAEATKVGSTGVLRKDFGLQEVDIRSVSNLISYFGLPDLPWQLSGESIAQTTPPARAYKSGPAYVVISNPNVEHVVVWSVLVEPEGRGKNLGAQMLQTILANHPGKTWHVPAIFPEEFTKLFEQAGFQKEELSQWQMSCKLIF